MKKKKKFISLLLSVLIALTSSCFSFFAYAVTDFSKDYTLQIYYYDANNEFVEVTEQVQVMEQYDVQLYACLVYSDGTVWDMTTSGMPIGLEGYTVDWTSDARYLAFCENNDGNVHGYDATKGEAIRNWIKNEVGTIPVVGESLATAILNMLENGAYDIDDLDTEDVTKILSSLLATMGLSEYEEQLTASLKEYLDKYDVGITATLKDSEGNAVSADTVRVLVLKSDALLSDVIPNAAFIKNYDDIPRKVAVGYEMDLEGIITPVRTHYTCTWTVTGELGVLASELATVDENGHFTALKEGTVQVKVSPDVDGMTQKLTDAFNALAAAGELADNESIAKAILLILGIKSDSDDYSTLLAIINAVLESGVDVNGVIEFGQENLTPLVNFILYVIYQDSVTIEIVSPGAIPIESFEVSGTTDITEGETSEFSIVNVMPKGAVAHDYKVSIENEEYAVQTEKNGLTVLGIDGSTWNNNYVTPNKTNLVVNMEGLTVKTQLSIYGKSNKKVVYIKIGCDEYLPIDELVHVNATTYPKRLSASLSYGWLNDDGTYNLATADQPAYTPDGYSYVTADGVLYATGCTVNQLVVVEANGAVATKQIMSGIQTTGVEFTKKHFWLKVNSGAVSTGIRGSVCEMYANILPADASFNELTFTSDDTESVILSAIPLTTSQYASAALTKERRAKYASATVTCDENGMATVYAYAIGNTSCFANVKVTTQTGGFEAWATVAFANISVVDVTITSAEDELYLQEDGTYLITAGDTVNFNALVYLSQTGSWKDQGFENVEWSVSDERYGTITDAGIFKGIEVGYVDVTATSVFGEISDTVTVRVLPNYTELKKAIAECDYENLDPYDWSVASWNVFDALYQEAVTKIAGNLFNSQQEVDDLTVELRNAFNGLVRYMPLEALEVYCADDADGNGFATISVSALSNYTNYSTTIVPTVYPLEAEDYEVVFTSSDTSKIVVDSQGVVKPVSSSDAGWGKITVSVTDPKNYNIFTKELYVAFAKHQVTSVSVSPTTLNFVGVGEFAETPSAIITPKYNTSSSVTSASIKHGFFVSSDESVATVDSNGTVLPVNKGSCVITFYSYDGGYTAQTSVSVTTNKKALEAAINTAESLVEEFYTEDTYAVVMESLVTAKQIFENEDSTQDEINAAAQSLNDALGKLEKNPYANVYLSAGEGGKVVYDNVEYTGDNNQVRVLIENGLSVSAVADDGYHFVKWVDNNGNTLSTNATEIFTIDYSAHFKAVFEKVNSVTGVKVFVNGQDTEFYTKDVATLSTYTSQSVKISYSVTPADANFYTAEYSLSNGDLKISSDTVSPSSNNACYALLTVTVTNTITGAQFTDSVYIAFAKHPIESVSANVSSLVFNGENSDAQTVSITYNSSDSSSASLKKGMFVSHDASIAQVDSNGVVTPASIGNTTVEFISFDGGHRAFVEVKVYADKSVLSTLINQANSVVEKNFTPESYASMQEALSYANEIYSLEYASQQDVDIAAGNLEFALNSLVKMDMVDLSVNIEGNGYIYYGEDVISQNTVLSVKNGEAIELSAQPDDDNQFEGWYNQDGSLITVNPDYTVSIDGFVSLTAKFTPIVYVQSVEITVNGESVERKHLNVGTVANYSKQSAEIGYIVNPSNPTGYFVRYYLGTDCYNLTLDSTTIHPTENEIAYGTVYVSITDLNSGKVFTDSVSLAFSKYHVTGVKASTNELIFNGENSAGQNVDIEYSSSSVIYNASVRRGYVVVENNDIASASTVIGDNGSYVIVIPKAIGSTYATFYSYDGDYSCTFSIKVYADKSALLQALDVANSLNGEDYTEETFSSLPPVIDYATQIYSTEYATQDDVDLATSSLNEVMSTLVLRDLVSVNAVSGDNGNISINGEDVSNVKVMRGEAVTLKAVADKDYMFDGWYENGEKISSESVYTFNAEKAVSLIAKFVEIPYITRVAITYDGVETDFAQVSVSSFGKYTNYSASFGVNVYPENADYTIIGYSIEDVNNNLSISSNTVKPSSNNPAYGKVVVSIQDNYSGKIYKDVIYPSFAKVQVQSVSVSPTSLSFDTPSSPSANISASYKGSTSISTPNIKSGFFVSTNENVASVNNVGTVTPKGKGSCEIIFYAYDGGAQASTSVTVKALDTVCGRIVAMISPDADYGEIGVENAVVTIGNDSATTDSNGCFTISISDNSVNTAVITYSHGITRNIDITNAGADIGTIAIVACDGVKDGKINAKDYAYFMKNNASDDMLQIVNNFYGFRVYTTDFYDNF